jgi:hypothetical protein
MSIYMHVWACVGCSLAGVQGCLVYSKMHCPAFDWQAVTLPHVEQNESDQ